jgi:valyl-tRNA synthetase
MKKELPKAYEPGDYEDKIYKKWEESGFFNPDNLKVKKNAEYFSVCMPPPNVTGILHLGHALENSIMDIEVRFQRLKGKKTLLIPGTDHAAVATQAKVEKVLMAKGIKNPRLELGREKLLDEIRDYAEKSKNTIISQIKKLGTSCDWSRLAYTFDEKRSEAVNEVFISMYKDGLIYKGYRTVNWSVKGQSTCSDDELVYVEQKSELYTFRYSKDFPIPIATTRPETKLGDTAVAVNPKDSRYKKYIGNKYVIDIGAKKPLEIQIIGDETIDKNFGTGAVGVTPAHSMIDHDLYRKHKLNLIPVIGIDGKMTDNAGADYEGLTVMEARIKIVQYFKENGLLEKTDEIENNIATSDRFGDIIEVIPMEQWFVDVKKKIPNKGKSLKQLMRDAVLIGHNGNSKKIIKITPKRFNKQYLYWIDNLRDWCISRQIWWGHRIPAWYKGNEIFVGKEAPKEKGWVQDSDTLDTWFSSGLWTFSTLGWSSFAKATDDKPSFAKATDDKPSFAKATDDKPSFAEADGDLVNYHPTSWMQMGYEIIFFWMARMILMSTYAIDDIPFKNVYIHGMLRDKHGRKFSKSLGNGIDPIEVIQKYGADALRLSLILGIAPGNDSKFYEEKIEGARNLVNKLWNISRFIFSNFEETPDNSVGRLSIADTWIVSKKKILIDEVTSDLNNYRFSQAGEKLREFTWNDFADWYLEVCKFERDSNKETILNSILKDLLKMWHPFIPFATEAIWSNLSDSFLMVDIWPQSNRYTGLIKGTNGDNFELIKEIVTAVRNARNENKVAPGKKIKAIIYSKNKKELLESQTHLLKNLRTGLEEVEIKDSGDKIKNAIYIVVSGIEIYLLGAFDDAKNKERIQKDVEQLEKRISILKIKLDNKEFTKNAPKEIVMKEKEKLAGLKIEIEKLKKI